MRLDALVQRMQGRGDRGKPRREKAKQAKAEKKLDAEISKVEAQPVRYKALTSEERADAETYAYLFQGVFQGEWDCSAEGSNKEDLLDVANL